MSRPSDDPRRAAAERVAAIGPKGDKGDRGERGLPRPQRQAIVSMFLLNLAIMAAIAWGLFHSVQMNGQERCTSIEQIIRIPVPHPVAGNPSREWESRYEAIEARRARQLGCG